VVADVLGRVQEVPDRELVVVVVVVVDAVALGRTRRKRRRRRRRGEDVVDAAGKDDARGGAGKRR